MSGPFRDQETLYLCPRCGDVMVGVFEGVHGCVRCRGTWIPQPVVERAFGAPTWPVGANAWWHRALECPECATQMNAVSIDHTLVDRCPAHGAWLDQGELRRFLDARDASDLAALHRTLKIAAPFADIDYASDSLRRRQLELSQQRKAQLAIDAAAADAEQARRDAEQVRQETERAEAEARERRQRAEQQRAERLAVEREREQAARLQLEQQREFEKARTDSELRQRIEREAHRRRGLEAERRQLYGERDTLENEIARMRDSIAGLERKLSSVRSRLLVITQQLDIP